MKINILTENQSSAIGILAEWGLSLFIEFNDKKILFDTGFSDVFIKNAKSMNIDINKSDFVIFSHFHRDHTGGMNRINFTDKKQIICHPDCYDKLPNKLKSIYNNHKLKLSKFPIEFTENAYFLSEIPRKSKFEKGIYKNDNMLDDTALAFKTDKGAIVITGCSHSGITNICEYAKQITGQSLYSVIGGFHLFQNEVETVDGTIDYFKNENIKHLYPMHCVDFPTMNKLNNLLGIKKYSAGEIISL